MKIGNEPQKLLAHRILDDVKVGIYRNKEQIVWALLTLGDMADRL